MNLSKIINLSNLYHKLEKEFDTPLYVYFEEIIQKNINKVFSVFKGFDFNPTFAVKANLNPILLKIIGKAGFGADVVSSGELFCSELANIDPSKIIWNGNGKTENDMRLFLEKKVGIVNIDSFGELKNWAEMLKNNSYKPQFFVRINPEVDSNTHPYISTGLNRHKFGITIDQIPNFIKLANSLGICISGFHTHIGSQITDINPFYDNFSKVINLSHKYLMKMINIGGGWGIDYLGLSLDLELYRERILPLFKGFKIYSEFGRYIIGDAGIYLTKVIDVKFRKYNSFVIVNGGMNHLIRPVLYNAVHNFKIIGGKSDDLARFDIVGPLCETGDYLFTGANDYLPEKNSLIAFENVGAYGFSMANNYNGTLRPAEVLVKSDGSYQLIRERENNKDLFSKIIFSDGK